MTLEAFLLADIAMLVGAGAYLTAFVSEDSKGEQDSWMFLLAAISFLLIFVGTIPPAFLVVREIVRFVAGWAA